MESYERVNGADGQPETLQMGGVIVGVDLYTRFCVVTRTASFL